MHDWKSLSHIRWDCKYHVVIVPKYRKRKLYGKFRKHVGEILRDLCRQKGIKLLERRLIPNHIQYVSAFLKNSVCICNFIKYKFKLDHIMPVGSDNDD